MSEQPIGFLVDGGFYCHECAERIAGDSEKIPVFRVNIGIYSQNCFLCHANIIKGVSCQLFQDKALVAGNGWDQIDPTD